MINVAVASDPRNHNVPGDGKYDLSFLNQIKVSEFSTYPVKPNTISHLEVSSLVLANGSIN